MLVSGCFPAISLPAGLALSLLRLGLVACLAVEILLGLVALTVVLTWRPFQWVAVERFLFAAMLGSVVTVFSIVTAIARILTHAMQSLSNSAGGLSSCLSESFGNAIASSIHIGFGLILAFAGTVAWAMLTRRASYCGVVPGKPSAAECSRGRYRRVRRHHIGQHDDRAQRVRYDNLGGVR